MSVFVIKFEKDNLEISQWVLNGNEDLEKAIIEMLNIDFEFIKKIRGYKNEI